MQWSSTLKRMRASSPWSRFGWRNNRYFSFWYSLSSSSTCCTHANHDLDAPRCCTKRWNTRNMFVCVPTCIQAGACLEEAFVVSTPVLSMQDWFVVSHLYHRRIVVKQDRDYVQRVISEKIYRHFSRLWLRNVEVTYPFILLTRRSQGKSSGCDGCSNTVNSLMHLQVSSSDDAKSWGKFLRWEAITIPLWLQLFKGRQTHKDYLWRKWVEIWEIVWFTSWIGGSTPSRSLREEPMWTRGFKKGRGTISLSILLHSCRSKPQNSANLASEVWMEMARRQKKNMSTGTRSIRKKITVQLRPRTNDDTQRAERNRYQIERYRVKSGWNTCDQQYDWGAHLGLEFLECELQSAVVHAYNWSAVAHNISRQKTKGSGTSYNQLVIILYLEFMPSGVVYKKLLELTVYRRNTVRLW